MQHYTTQLLLFLFSLFQLSSAVNNSLIDFSTAPNCALKYCLNSDSPYSWTSQNLCPPSDNNEDIGISCFCDSPHPLLCLPYDPSVPNPCYTSSTTWITTLCSTSLASSSWDIKQIAFLQLPNCARDCARMMASHLGCPDFSLNCGCQLGYLPGNVAECIRNGCRKDILTYIGDLDVFTAKWMGQGCGLPPEEGYKNSPAAYPQEILVDDFEGKEYSGWQKGLDDKRKKKASLGVIISMSLVFGGIFGILGLQWVIQLCGCNRPSNRGRFRRGCGMVVEKLVGGIGVGFGLVWQGISYLGKGVLTVLIVVWGWVPKKV